MQGTNCTHMYTQILGILSPLYSARNKPLRIQTPLQNVEHPIQCIISVTGNDFKHPSRFRFCYPLFPIWWHLVSCFDIPSFRFIAPCFLFRYTLFPVCCTLIPVSIYLVSGLLHLVFCLVTPCFLYLFPLFSTTDSTPSAQILQRVGLYMQWPIYQVFDLNIF